MPIKVFLAVNIKSGKAKEVQKSLKDIDVVQLACVVTDGEYDIVALIEVSSLDEYRTFSIDKVSGIPHITDYTSFIIMDE